MGQLKEADKMKSPAVALGVAQSPKTTLRDWYEATPNATAVQVECSIRDG